MIQPVPTKALAQLLMVMVETRLVSYKHYFPWTDRIIMEMPDPPAWVVDLATAMYYGKALEIIGNHIHREPFEASEFDPDDASVACYFLRYRRGEISWATFLDKAGNASDSASGGRKECEYFYSMLNDLENQEFDHSLELRQVEEVQSEFQGELTALLPVYELFTEYFREYVKTH